MIFEGFYQKAKRPGLAVDLGRTSMDFKIVAIFHYFWLNL